MKGMRGSIRAMLLVFVAMFLILGGFLSYTVFVNGDKWFASPYNPMLNKQKQDVIEGSILDRNGVVLASSDEATGKRAYHPDERVRRALCHVLGDPSGISAVGIESVYSQYLLGFNGNPFERLYDTIANGKRKGDSVVTTLSAELSAYAFDQMNGKSGAVVVMNYKTGEILTSVSTPGFDLSTLTKNTASTSTESYLVNRATMGRYTPGSVFKLVTAAAVLEFKPELMNKKYTCTGELKFPTGTVVDAGHAVHGELTVQQALAKSCNVIFAQIEKDLGMDAILKMAEKMHYNEDFVLGDMTLYKSQFLKAQDGTLDAAWDAVGQYKTTVSPMHILMITSSIANDGIMMEPKVMKAIMNSRNYQYITASPAQMGRVLSSESAAKLREMMQLTVKSGTGTNAAIKGYTIGGKTGSAETSDSKNTKTHAWFTGYVQDDKHPLCIVVMVEHGGSGGSVAAPIAQKVLKKALDLGL